MKRLLDIILSIATLLFIAPIIILVAFLVRIKLGTPVFFSQIRPGFHGKPFIMYKFRTMTDERNEHGQLLPDQQRLTRFGKLLRSTSLDEFPALINVIKGEMSLVGPRPLLMEYLDRYTPEQARRHDMRPGITGWAQVNGRNAISCEEKFKFDVWYVDNQTFWLDLKILWMTLVKVFKREGISQLGQVTSEKFRGSTLNNGK